MRVEVHIDPDCKETTVVVTAREMSEEVRALTRRLSQPGGGLLTVWEGERALLLDQGELLRVYASNKEVHADAGSGEYLVKLRLYEVEERLDPTRFVRISQSEIANLKKVERLDLSLCGTIRVTLAGGGTTYVSRRYVKGIKEVLGL